MIDIRKGSHISSFPTLISSMMNTYKRVYNITLGAATDNGQLATRGAYISFDNYAQGAVTDGDVTIRVNELGADGRWICEVMALPSDEVLYLYNSPVSEYSERDLQDESLFYNAQGDVVQGAPLLIGDLFSLSENAFVGTPAAGKTAEYTSGKYEIQ